MAVNAVPQGLVEELRSAFLKELSEKGVESIHPKDHERIKKDDHWLRRFLAHNESNIQLTIKMMWTSVMWRKELQVNDISENNIKMDIIIKGAFFPHGRDIDGKLIFIFKGKVHNKGAVDSDELKRCVIYWFERIERMTKGDQITIFFDLEGCGLSNMDMQFTKYLIGLFKDYYPYFLNYIIIFEMAWVLNAAFKIIKSWLPEKAIEKLKVVGRKDVFTYVPKSEALASWGGDSTYQFSFIPEEKTETDKTVPESNSLSVKKVHFMDGSPMSEQPPPGDTKEDGPLRVNPPGIITFVREDADLVSTLELHNTDSSIELAFKLKTTSPEKFRVKPSTGCLKPGAKDVVTVTLLPGFQLGGLSKDKFLVMSCAVEEKEVANLDLSELWKNTTNRKVHQIRLRCVQSSEVTRNGNLVVNHASSSENTDSQLLKLSCKLGHISDNQEELSKSLMRMHYLQIGQFLLSVFLVGPLRVNPPKIITFVREGADLVSTLELHNTDSSIKLAFKLKTTSPKKFRVKPCTGYLKPGAKDVVTVTLLPGFQLGGLSKDKFMVMSCAVKEKEVANLDLSELWKNTRNRKVHKIRLRCVQSSEVTRNGNLVVNHASPSENTDSQLLTLSCKLGHISENQEELSKSLKRMHYLQIGQFLLFVILGITVVYLLKSVSGDIHSENTYCRDPRAP